MAYVIAVCGAGGKTTFCKSIAESYLYKGKKVCIITTTHFWNNVSLSDISDLKILDYNKVHYFGRDDGNKVSSVTDSDYEKLYSTFDYIIVEADGSRMKPLKIPRYQLTSNGKEFSEPIIPKFVSEIIVVMGLESIGREFASVCQRAELYIEDKCSRLINEKTIVSEKMIDDIINNYYILPLKKKYSDASFNSVKIDFKESGNYKNVRRLALVLCASGFSTRFDDINKLFVKINDNEYNEKTIEKSAKMEMYKIMLEKLRLARSLLIDKLKKELFYTDLNVEIAIVTQYDEIINDPETNIKAKVLKNDIANQGISTSIKIATNYYRDYDGIMFLNADMPKLPYKEISNFLFYSVCSNCKLSSMFNEFPKNPAYFEKEYFDELLLLDGDVGAKELLIKNMMNSYKYHIANEYLKDIDTLDDLNGI